MNWELKDILKKKANKTIAIILSLAILLTMVPAFALPVSAAAETGVFSAAQAANGGNYVTLNWAGVPGSKYAISKSSGGDVYETIPLKYNIRVLNVYPNVGNNLYDWMGTGKNSMGSPTINDKEYTMTVVPVSMNDFTTNPSTYLGTAGHWNYDVVYFGGWDSNNSCDIDTTAQALLEKFIKANGGVLLGHDTAADNHSCFKYLAANYLNLQANTISLGDPAYIPTYGNTSVKVMRKGLLTNYPYTLGDVGTLMTVPESHSYHEFASGNIWFSYNRIGSETDLQKWDYGTPEMTTYNGKTGTNNFYLTTLNNMAMIQTGHSNGNATPDERKILTNTLYYLAQTTTETSFDDHSAQDLAAPSAVAGAVTVSGNTISFPASTDNGNTYDYKLFTVNDNACTKSDTGKTATATVTSGIKNYSIVVNQSKSPADWSTAVSSTSTSYNIGAKTAGDYYLHVKAIDNAGNASEESVLPFTVAAAATPTVTQQSASTVSAKVQSTVTFSATISPSGAGSVTYLWQKKGPLDANWSNISSSNGTGTGTVTYTTPTLTTSDNGTQYRCVATNSLNNTTASTPSSAFTVNVSKYTTSLTPVTGSPDSPNFPVSSVTLSSTLSGCYSTSKDKMVNFYNGSNFIGSAKTDENGTATCPWSNPGVGSYSITAKYVGDDDNSSATSSALSYGINKGTQAALTITDPGSKTYGDSPFKLSVSGGTGSGTVSFTSSNNNILKVDSNGNVTIVGAGQAIITVTKDGDSSYDGPISKDITITVAPKPLDVTITPNNKVYDAGTGATVKSISYSGIVGSDDVSISGGTLTYSDKKAGTNKTVTFSGYSLTGAQKDNYTLHTITVNSANITQKPLTVTNSSVKDKIYDGTPSAEFTGTPALYGLCVSDKVTLVNGTPSFESKEAGDSITVDYSPFSIAGDDAENYVLTQPASIVAKISKATLTVSVNPISIKRGQSINDHITVSVTGFVNHETAASLASSGYTAPTATTTFSDNTTSVSGKSITVSYSGGNATGNYQFDESNHAPLLTVNSTAVTAGDYTVTGTAGSWSENQNPSLWSNSNLTVAPANGYDQISTDGSNWNNSLTISNEKKNGAFSFYLRNSTEGTLTDSKTIYYNLDKAAPTGTKITFTTNPAKKIVSALTFGLFFNDTTDVNLSATDNLNEIKQYEYQLVNDGDAYNVNGQWKTCNGSFSINPQFKGVIYARAVDNAGNKSNVVTSDKFVVDKQTPTAPNIAATVDGSTYTSGWTSGNVELKASGSSAPSGIDHYEYKIGDSGIWTAMPEQSGANDSTTGNAIGDTLKITSNMNDAIHIRVVSNSGISGNESVITVHKDSVIPSLHVAVSGITGQWTQDAVTFTLSNTANTISPVTYWVKIGSDPWTKLSGNTYKVSGNVNTTYQFKVVSASGLESSVSDTYTVKLASDALKEVIKDIDNLPDPNSAPDKDITDNEQSIKDTKILFDTLNKDEQSAVGQTRMEKLNKLINRLNSLLVIIPKDTDTGITAGNIGTSVTLPELNDPEVGKVEVKLAVNPIVSSDTHSANIAIATEGLGQSGTNLVAAFDVSLIKSVFDSAGNQTSTGKVSNSNIRGPITIQIPIPANYQGRTDLQVVYIDDNGNVTPLTTTLVTIDGVQYLQFTTTHFSVYAVTAPEQKSSVHNPETSDSGNQFPVDTASLFGLAVLSTGSILSSKRKLRKYKRS